ncbi:hypothetical protein SUGI_0173550 [Cryptomeria japonica]|nr:hypothetical protein SUGI_0173550 [Cryptomeria japonica]
MEEPQKISDHTNQSLKSQLAVFGSVISEEADIMTFLGSLPASYSSLVVSTQASLDLQQEVGTLVQEEVKRKDASFNDEFPITMFSMGSKGEKSWLGGFWLGKLKFLEEDCSWRKSRKEISQLQTQSLFAITRGKVSSMFLAAPFLFVYAKSSCNLCFDNRGSV